MSETALDVRRLAELENVIERGLGTFIEVGRALAEIRDSRLYLDTHTTFEGYCRERWGWGRNYINKMIAGSEAAENIKGTTVPTSEGQIRPLSKLAPGQQREAWTAATERAEREGKARPTAAMVDDAVAGVIGDAREETSTANMDAVMKLLREVTVKLRRATRLLSDGNLKSRLRATATTAQNVLHELEEACRSS